MSLIELKLAAGRARDEADIVELIRANSGKVDAILSHLQADNSVYVERFKVLAKRAREETDR